MKWTIFHYRDYDKDFFFRVSQSEPPTKRAAWTRDKSKVDRRVRRWKEKHWYNQRVEDFALSKAFIEDDPREDDKWECTDLLGAGSFGIVAKWCKFDSNRRVVDVLAVKQYNPSVQDSDRTGRPGVPSEIALPVGLMYKGCKNIPQTRNEVYFQHPSMKPQWRMYNEFCPHGTLFDLVRHYREVNEGRHNKTRIPEAFIWHAFLGFAKACHHFSTFRLSQFKDVKEHDGDRYIVHLDLKDANVLLGKPNDDPNEIPYPVIKVADFGLAEYTNRSDPKNSSAYKHAGTICWWPPEQCNSGRYGSRWQHQIFGRNRPFTSKHVVWQMGANIFGLMELDVNNKKVERQMKDVEHSESRLRDHNYSLFFGYRNRNYSQALCDLVDDCLNIKPGNRPEPIELVNRAWKGLEKYEKEYRRNKRLDKLHLSS